MQRNGVPSKDSTGSYQSKHRWHESLCDWCSLIVDFRKCVRRWKFTRQLACIRKDDSNCTCDSSRCVWEMTISSNWPVRVRSENDRNMSVIKSDRTRYVWKCVDLVGNFDRLPNSGQSKFNSTDVNKRGRWYYAEGCTVWFLQGSDKNGSAMFNNFRQSLRLKRQSFQYL
jgi:hypothetical protein